MSAIVLQFFIRLLARLPLPWLQAMGRGGGWLLWRVPNRERETARINLALCFPGLDEKERERLLRSTLQHAAMTLLEMPAAWYRSSRYWSRRMELGQVPEEVKALLDQGRGVIIAIPHLGNFELTAHVCEVVGRPATALYRPPRKAGLEKAMHEGRNHGPLRMLPIGRQGLRALGQALARGEFVGLLPDQQPKKARGGAGVFAPFFGVPAYTMTLVHRLARRSGAPVYFLGVLRQGKGRYRVVGLKGDPAIGGEDAEAAAAALNAGIEAMVRMAPEQYLWSYRRFELQPDGSNPYRASRLPENALDE